MAVLWRCVYYGQHVAGSPALGRHLSCSLSTGSSGSLGMRAAHGVKQAGGYTATSGACEQGRRLQCPLYTLVLREKEGEEEKE